MIFYSPHTKELYTSSDYKLDKGHNTPTIFNLQYDGGIFVGHYNSSSSATSIEPFPEGTSVSFPLKSAATNDVVHTRGIVISVPIPRCSSQLPATDQDAPPYTIWLIDGSVHSVSPDFLESIVTTKATSSHLPKFYLNFPIGWVILNASCICIKGNT
jgi:hypothetical protein